MRSLVNGDAIVTIRRDGPKVIRVRGTDPQTEVDHKQFEFEGKRNVATHPDDHMVSERVASTTGSALVHAFTGSQVRLLGYVSEEGRLTDVYIDDTKQLGRDASDCGREGLRPMSTVGELSMLRRQTPPLGRL